MDYSTIDKEKINRTWKVNKKGKTDRYSESLGSGCSGDPPGFPSYFIQSVYSAAGSDPRSGSEWVIMIDGIPYAPPKHDWDNRDEILGAVYLPLPIDHQRTRLWIEDKYRNHNHCYHMPEHRDRKDWSDKMMIWPGGCLGKTPFGTLKNLEHEIEWAKERDSYDKWTAQHQDNFRIQIEGDNERITEYCNAVAIPDNHDAVILIRRWYPDYQPEPDLILNPPKTICQWWETEAVQPSEADCASTQRWKNKHPFSETWCQWCGRTYKEKA